MGDTLTDDFDTVDNDRNLDDTTPDTDDAGSDSFPDPVLDEEPPAPSGTVPPVQAEGLNLPAAPPPPPPQPDLPPAPTITDGGFTPQRDDFASPAPAPASQVQFFTREQLKRGVEEGLISEDQMAEQLQLQTKELAKREALAEFQAQQRTHSLTTQIQEYRNLVPGWDQVGTPANQRVNPIWQQLLDRGFPNNEATKLEALERAFGTATYIKQARQTQTQTAQLRETPQGVSRRGPAPSSRKGKDPLSTLSKGELSLYQRYINEGKYSGWEEVEEEVAYAAKQTVNRDLQAKHAGLMR